MHICVQRLNFVKNKIKEIIDRKQLKTIPQIIAVTKSFPLNKITPLLEMGHIHFGENKIQEAESKWLNVKNKYKPTKGCVAIAKKDFLKILPLINNKTKISIG